MGGQIKYSKMIVALPAIKLAKLSQVYSAKVVRARKQHVELNSRTLYLAIQVRGQASHT